MTSLPVIVIPAAELQVAEVVLHIARDSAAKALAWEARLATCITALGDFHGHAVDEDGSRRAGETVRKVVFERTYLIHYVVEVGVAVVVVNVRHGARQPAPDEP